ncbi:MAG: SpoIID/LytB domain-containing protein [Acidobacteriia bacterium]|nr:SpoIID/LytB domain-containing protein [Terriglobia bacterium]
MRRVLLLAMLLAPVPAAAQATEIKVRLYSLLPPSSLTISPTSGAVRWRACATCHDSTLRDSLQIDAADGRLHIAGQSQNYASILITGAYRLAGFQHPVFEAAFPLEIRARGPWLLLTLRLPLEDYVAAVLAAESGNQQSDQSLQAMAVAARTFAVHFRGRHKTEAFDFCDTTHCQDFRFSAINDRIRAAVEATEGELLWYEGRPAATYYHQNCGGTTADAADVWPGHKLPYLREHTDPYCSRSNGSQWHSSFAKAELETALVVAGLRPPAGWKALEVKSRTAAGRALKLHFTGTADTNATMSASSFRFAVDRALGWNQIRSDLYDLRNSGDQITFIGRGSGHGVGLCQAGAEEMGREGKTYHEILAFYYPGTSLGVTSQGLAWESQSSERLELVTTQGREDVLLIAAGEKLMREAESATGLRFDFRPRLKVYPSLDTYRDSTGEPGWVAASTRGHTVRMQPAALLRAHSALDSTLRHEFIHLLVEAHARRGLPLWFREGIVLYLSDPAAAGHTDPPASQNLEKMFQHAEDRGQMEQAYAAARARVAALVQQNGKDTVTSWLARGLPANLAALAAEPAHH